ncbi:hypothetical protein L1987_71053 [Smallanthus sonchifolius]|uniref:Uncharacterized protein n=1 Tax=Smallanthus sonchifolius TaxID=185202 RepID=A0ACB9ASQ2_9ASTR|nr:hypothetical protein L1987_71053 [Smallanthus sonchifolius]
MIWVDVVHLAQQLRKKIMNKVLTSGQRIINQREAASSNIFKHREFNLQSLGTVSVLSPKFWLKSQLDDLTDYIEEWWELGDDEEQPTNLGLVKLVILLGKDEEQPTNLGSMKLVILLVMLQLGEVREQLRK